jgi:hypothetical protein
MDENLVIAQNVSTPQETLASLASTMDYAYNRLVGEDQISESTWEVIGRYGQILIAIIQNINTPLDTLKTLSTGMLCQVANDPNTSPQILEKLANIENNYLREAVAKNLNCPPQILEKLELPIDRY